MKISVFQLWDYIKTWGFHEDIKNIKEIADGDTDGDDDFEFAAADAIHNCTILLFGWGNRNLFR